MSDVRSVHPSVKIDGVLLQKDRKLAGFTQASLCAACDSVSLATIRRAEQGYRIIESSLKRIAKILNHPRERYIVRTPLGAPNNTAISLAGLWTGIYVEANQGTLPYLVVETISIRQDGSSVEGTLINNGLSNAPVERFKDCVLVENVLTGSIWTEGCVPPAGLSTFNLMVTRSGDWLDGYCSWFDVDSDQVEQSRFITVRQDSPNYTRYLSEAKACAEAERSNYRLRKLTESGYELCDAIKMLTALQDSEL